VGSGYSINGLLYNRPYLGFQAGMRGLGRSHSDGDRGGYSAAEESPNSGIEEGELWRI